LAANARARRALLRAAPAGVDPVPDLLARGRALRRTAPADARALARAAFVIARLRRDARARVEAARLLGQVALLEGRPRSAKRLLEHASTSADAALRADIAPELATTLSILGRDEDARRTLEDARSRLAPRGTAGRRGLLEMAEGNVLERLDRHEDALRSLNLARERLSRLGRHALVSMIDLNRANVLGNLGRYDHADRLYRRSQRFHAGAGQAAAALQVSYNHAYLEYLRGRFHESLARFADVRRQFEGLGDARHVALCDLDSAEILLRLDLPDAAASTASRSIGVFEGLGMVQEAARARFFAAAAARRRSAFAEARTSLEGALAEFRRLSCASWEAVCLQRLAEMDRADGATDRAAARADEAAAKLEALGMAERAGRADVLLAAIELDRGAAADAAARVTRRLKRLGDLHAPWLRCEAAVLLARTLEAQGRVRAATGHALRAVALLERHRMAAPPDEYMAAFLRGKAEIYEIAIRLVLRLGGRHAAARAFDLAERSKARALLDLLGTERSPRPGARATREREADRLAREIEGLTGRLPDADGAASAPAAARRDAENLRRREARLRACLAQRAASPGASHEPPDGDLASLDTVARALSPDTTLLEYHVGERQLVIFVVAAGGYDVVRTDTTRAELKQLIARMRFHLDRSDLTTDLMGEEGIRAQTQAANAALEALGAALLAPVEASIRTPRVVVVPHGDLHAVPFAALPVGGEALLEHHEVVHAPSATILLRPPRRRAVGASRSRGVEVLGVPDAEAPSIEAEARDVAAAHPDARVHLGPAATRRGLGRAVRRARIVHVASHAAFRAEDPMASALVLGDGPMSTDDVYRMRIEADLVVLSGCATGRATMTEGDDPLGLIRGFLRAGARALVTSLWRVTDRSAVTLMERFHRELAGGASAATALRTAALEVRALAPHPHHWAPFALTSGGLSRHPAPARIRSVRPPVPDAGRLARRRFGAINSDKFFPVSKVGGYK